jgi:carbon-monoxide dehydrogenase large subunit
MSILGTRVIRTEDPRLLTAGGVYVDDLRTPELNGAARVTFVRSPVAHARITGIDASEALAEPGVIAVLTVADMAELRRVGRQPGAARRPVGRAPPGDRYGAIRRRAGRGGDYR